jgi:hypothetical protein
MELKIYTYKNDTGELVEEYFYSDFLFVFNNIISHNFIYENDKLNLIISTEFPPKDLKYENKKWIVKEKLAKSEYSKLIKFFE